MLRRNFIKKNMGMALAGVAVTKGMGMNYFFGDLTATMPTIKLISPYLTKLIVKPIKTDLYQPADETGGNIGNEGSG